MPITRSQKAEEQISEESNDYSYFDYSQLNKSAKKERNLSRVEKIDRPERFAEIESNQKTYGDIERIFGKSIAEKYSTILNVVREAYPNLKGLPTQSKHNKNQNITWLSKHHQKVHTALKNKYDREGSDYAPSTTRMYLEQFANFLLAIDKNKHKTFVRQLFIRGKELKNIIDSDNTNTMKDEDRANFVPYEYLVEKRDQVQKYLQAGSKSMRDSRRWHMYHMILSLVTYIPPIRRSNWLDVEIIRHGEKRPTLSGDQNKLYEESPGKWVYFLNKDKVSSKTYKHGRMAIDFQNEEIKIAPVKNVHNGKQITDFAKLNEIITESLRKWPRPYLLCGLQRKKNKSGTYVEHPMPASTYDKCLAELFSPRQPRSNLIRKAYINYWYSKSYMDQSTKEKIARLMRHTTEIAQTAYKKVDIHYDPKDDSVLDAGAQPKYFPTVPPPPQKQSTFNLREWSRQYREKNKKLIKQKRDAHYQKNRDDVLRYKLLYNLNKGNVTNPRQSSLDKYGIEYSDDLKRWISI